MVLNDITWLVISTLHLFSIYYGNEHASSSVNDVDYYVIMIKSRDSIKNTVHRTLRQYTTTRKIVHKQKILDNVVKNIGWAEGKCRIVLISNDGWKAESCGKIIVYGVSIQITVLMVPNNTNYKILFWTYFRYPFSYL
jgi:hypothetical protein